MLYYVRGFIITVPPVILLSAGDKSKNVSNNNIYTYQGYSIKSNLSYVYKYTGGYSPRKSKIQQNKT